ncbi:MAG: hypothetical protein ACRBCL_04410 [Maritimibacter sp.]
MTKAPDWPALIEPDEKLIWHGRPDQGFFLPLYRARDVVFGFVVLVISTVTLIASIMSGRLEQAGLISIVAVVGFCLFTIPLMADTLRARRSYYALTSHRAVIALARRGAFVFKTVVLAEARNITLENAKPPSVYFSEKTVRLLSFGSSTLKRKTVPDGFERIKDGLEVYQLMHNLTNKTATTQTAKAKTS